MSEFKDIILKLRNEKGFTQGQMADALGTSKSTVGMWEMGERFPSKELYEAIADYFNVDMDYLYGRTNVRQKIHFDNDGNAMIHSSSFYSRIIAYYEKLNDIGKKEAEKRLHELTQLDLYVKPNELDVKRSASQKTVSEEANEMISKLKALEEVENKTAKQ